MVFSIYAQDNEFAAATESNVNYSPGNSKFDYPPNSSKDLVITTKPVDENPRLFEIGDVYDVSFGGNGGATILNATVVRSDSAPAGGGVIVFEGLDENGDLTQVIWTPGFDLEAWYFDNFAGGVPPEFYTTDQNPAYTHGYVCFAEGTRIATPKGPKRVETLQAGDPVMTHDHGVQHLLWSGVRRVSGQGRNAPVVFRKGAIGNDALLRVSLQHRVMLASPMAHLFFGSSEVLVPARAMVNGHDIRIEEVEHITYVHLLLARHEILFANGAPCESLLVGDQSLAEVGVENAAKIISLCRVAMPAVMQAARPILTMQEARFVTGAPVIPKGVTCF